MRALALLLASITLSCHCAASWRGDEYQKRIRSTEQVAPLGDDRFGERINLFDGSLGFEATDIDLPGNSAIPVRLARSLDLQDRSFPHALYDWQLDVPYIGGIFPSGYEHLIGCDQPLPPINLPVGGHVFQRRDYWHGTSLRANGSRSSMLVEMVIAEELVHEGKVTKPAFAVSKWRTREGWFFECKPSGSAAPAAFIAHSPDGLEYTFAHAVVREHPPLYRQIDAKHVSKPLQRRDVRLYATRVEDRFGNFVEYVWNSQTSLRNDLQRIEANDGRVIEFEYAAQRIAGAPGHGTFGQIESAVAHGRTWTYEHDDVAGFGEALLGVVNPDASRWSFDRSQLKHEIAYQPDPANGPSAMKLAPADPARPCTWMTMFSTSGGGAYPAGGGTYSITHPSGATADFTLVAKRHGRANVPLFCRAFSDGGQQLNEPALFHDVLTLSTRTVSGPGLVPGTWQYAYAGLAGDHAPYSNLGYGTYTPSPAPHFKTVTVTDPDGVQRVHRFGKDFHLNEGRLLQSQVIANGVVHETRDHGFLAEDVFNQAVPGAWYTFPLPYRQGNVTAVGVDEFSASAIRPSTSRTITRDSTSYIRETTSVCHDGTLPCLDHLGRPMRHWRHSPGGSRTDQFAYGDDTGLWVLGQLAATVNLDTGLTVSETVYDGEARPWQRFAFGLLQETLGYHGPGSDQAGTLATSTDPNGQVTSFAEWKRGVPRVVTLPTQLHQPGTPDKRLAVVNDHGEIESLQDEVGSKTCYAYDPMGRLQSITHPSETLASVCSAADWTPTISAFERIDVEEEGLPPGHWRHTVTTGARTTRTWYDALWRPVLTRREATDGSAGARAIRRRFDWRNREISRSWPIESFADWDDPVFEAGIDTLYDPLDRVVGTATDSELSPSLLTTSTSHAGGNATHVDARGNATTTTWQAFDEPSLDAALTVQAGGITTKYTRDVFGNALTLTRQGNYPLPEGGIEWVSAKRTFVYDPARRLCKTIEHDAGTTIVAHDAVGNVAWRAAGQNGLSSTVDCQHELVSPGNRSLHAYDGMNRLVSIDHPVGTADVGFSHFANGNLRAATVGTHAGAGWATVDNEWTYTYARRGLPTSETLVIDGRTFPIAWHYNPRGDTAGVTYPGAVAATSFNPNAFGEARQSGPHATAATRHPNGRLASLAYANGTTRSIELNARGLVAKIVDSRFGVAWLDHTLGYDENANLASLFDAVIDPEAQPAETRSLAYDEHDRLIAVTDAPSGDESFAYDPLDNLRRSVSGGEDRRFTFNPATQRLQHANVAGTNQGTEYQWNGRGELTERLHYAGIEFDPDGDSGSIFSDSFEDLQTPEHFTFDRARRLVDYNGIEAYAYDAHHRRVRTTHSAGTRYTVYTRSGRLLLTEDSQSGESTEHHYVDTTPVADRTTPLAGGPQIVTYLHADHRGTPTVRTSGAGTRVYRSRLHPFGAPYDGIWRQGMGFTGHAMDEQSRLVYMQHRYYDPASMRFLSPDPLPPDQTGFNRYAYARNNPYTFADPDGRCEAPTGTRVCTSVRSFSTDDVTIVQSYDTRTQTPIPFPRGSDQPVTLEPVQRTTAKALNRAGRELQARGMKEHIAILNKIEVFLSAETVGEGKAFVSQPPAFHVIVNSAPFARLWGGHQVGAMLHEVHHFSAANRRLYMGQRANGGPMGTGTGYENDAFQFQRDLGFPASGYFDFNGFEGE